MARAPVLRVSDSLTLPLEAVTETFAFLAKRGAGKTYAAKVLVEEMLKAGAQVIVMDPLGVWYGLRSSADGKGPGLPIGIFGGLHGDLPLSPESGSFVADLLVTEGVSAILDFGTWSKAAQRRFSADFGERLFQRNEAPLHLVLEEADRWCPQRPQRGEERMLGAYEELVRRGRSRGVGVTLITQRSSVLHKDVLTQTEVLVAMRTPAEHDRKAVRAWFDAHEASDQATVMAELPSLPTGTGWVSSPYWLGKLAKVAFRRAETFDSSSTPTFGKAVREARTFADVDVAAIKEQMADLIEAAEADDPATLRRRIAALEAELRVAQDATPPEPEPEVVEIRVPAIDSRTVTVLEDAVAAARAAGVEITGAAQAIGEAITRAVAEVNRATAARDMSRAPAPKPQVSRSAPRERSRVVGEGFAGLITAGSMELARQPVAMLAALVAAHPASLTLVQLSTRSGYSKRSSSWSPSLNALLEAGLVVRTGRDVEATDAGVAALGGEVPAPRSRAELLDMWLGKLDRQPRAFLEALVAVHPGGLTPEDIAGQTGYSPTSSAFRPSLGVLAKNDLAQTDANGRWFASAEIVP